MKARWVMFMYKSFREKQHDAYAVHLVADVVVPVDAMRPSCGAGASAIPVGLPTAPNGLVLTCCACLALSEIAS